MMDEDVVDTRLNAQMVQREKAITKMTLMVWIGFFVCFAPTTLIVVLDPLPPSRKYPGLHVGMYFHVFFCNGDTIRNYLFSFSRIHHFLVFGIHQPGYLHRLQ